MNFSDPAAQTATQGNPTLTPFLSTNFDIGGEWYSGDEGYIGLTLFAKQITGSTVTGSRTIQFRQLGVPFESLSAQQQLAIIARGPQRAMFESNFPVDKGTCSYQALWNAFKRIAAGTSNADKQALFSGTATRVYRLSW